MSAFDSETAMEAARRSAEVRRRRTTMSVEERASEAIRTAAPALVKELLDAALNRGEFKGLKPEERLKALFRALEYGLGRPAQLRPENPEGPAIPTAADLFAEPVGDPEEPET